MWMAWADPMLTSVRENCPVEPDGGAEDGDHEDDQEQEDKWRMLSVYAFPGDYHRIFLSLEQGCFPPNLDKDIHHEVVAGAGGRPMNYPICCLSHWIAPFVTYPMSEYNFCVWLNSICFGWFSWWTVVSPETLTCAPWESRRPLRKLIFIRLYLLLQNRGWVLLPVCRRTKIWRKKTLKNIPIGRIGGGFGDGTWGRFMAIETKERWLELHQLN